VEIVNDESFLEGKPSGSFPLTEDHMCFNNGHAFYLVCQVDNGRSIFGEHKCSRCGHIEPFQFDYEMEQDA